MKSLKPQLDRCPLQSEKMSTSSADSGSATDLAGTSFTEKMFAPSLDPGNVTDLSDTSFTIISDKSSSKRGSHMLVAPSSSTGTVSKPGSVVSTSASSVVHADLTLLGQSQMTYHLDAWLTTPLQD